MLVTISSKPWLLKFDFATIAIKLLSHLVLFQLESRFEIFYGTIKIRPSENTSSVQFWSRKNVAINRRKTELTLKVVPPQGAGHHHWTIVTNTHISPMQHSTTQPHRPYTHPDGPQPQTPPNRTHRTHPTTPTTVTTPAKMATPGALQTKISWNKGYEACLWCYQQNFSSYSCGCRLPKMWTCDQSLATPAFRWEKLS